MGAVERAGQGNRGHGAVAGGIEQQDMLADEIQVDIVGGEHIHAEHAVDLRVRRHRGAADELAVQDELRDAQGSGETAIGLLAAADALVLPVAQVERHAEAGRRGYCQVRGGRAGVGDQVGAFAVDVRGQDIVAGEQQGRDDGDGV